MCVGSQQRKREKRRKDKYVKCTEFVNAKRQNVWHIERLMERQLMTKFANVLKVNQKPTRKKKASVHWISNG